MQTHSSWTALMTYSTARVRRSAQRLTSSHLVSALVTCMRMLASRLRLRMVCPHDMQAVLLAATRRTMLFDIGDKGALELATARQMQWRAEPESR